MSDKAYILALSEPTDLTTLCEWLEDAKNIATYYGACRMTEDDVLPKGEIAFLITADRGNLKRSILEEFGPKPWAGRIHLLDEFEDFNEHAEPLRFSEDLPWQEQLREAAQQAPALRH